MSIEAVIKNRRTIHNYSPSEIDHTLIKTGLELALLAPNHRFTFPWHFVIAGPETREKITSLALDLKLASPKSEGLSKEHVIRSVREKFLNPAALVVFFCKKSGDDFQEKEDYASVACGIQNFTLYLAEQGYGSKWSTGKITRHQKVFDILGVEENEYESCGFIWVGKSEGSLPPRRRPELNELLSETI